MDWGSLDMGVPRGPRGMYEDDTYGVYGSLVAIGGGLYPSSHLTSLP